MACASCAMKIETNSHHKEGHSYDHEKHHHNNGGFDLKREALLIGTVVALFMLGSIFESTLHNTPFTIAEYTLFIPLYLLSGWGVLTQAERNILKGQFFGHFWGHYDVGSG